ncbi:hypothetical protein NC651_038386 [Populus alba x Populus x berolinensis]|nr:hypothetical protein NC651_038386 [Populus alba x Populus x berolinensis]
MLMDPYMFFLQRLWLHWLLLEITGLSFTWNLFPLICCVYHLYIQSAILIICTSNNLLLHGNLRKTLDVVFSRPQHTFL